MVPIVTERMEDLGTWDLASTEETAVMMPLVMSTVVGVLDEASKLRLGEESCVRSGMAQSVLVPPASTPMRYIFAQTLKILFVVARIS